MIRVEHLTKCFGRFTAIEDVSLHIRPGEVFAFLGPNGSGKTTTMKTIVGLNLATHGRVEVAGTDVRTRTKEARRMVSYLPQRVMFPENLRTREVLRFYARLREIPEMKWKAALERAHFDGFGDKYVGELSGGMIQRLGLAVVAMPNAPVLILDEPTANLDPQGVKRFRDFVLEQKADGKTIVFSTHLLAEVELLADRVGIFVNGRLPAVESVSALHERYLEYQTMEDLYLHYVEDHS